MQETDELIRTKLHRPFIRPDLVFRLWLQAQILEGLSRSHTLVTAPAGFGKTTLVGSCVACCGMLVAWHCLEGEDDQVGRFLRYLVTAVHEAAVILLEHCPRTLHVVIACRSDPPQIFTGWTALAESLGLAEPERCVRVFLDEGQPMKRLLARWISRADDGGLRDYAGRLLSQFGTEPLACVASPSPASSAANAIAQAALAEPLSQRELEVLHLIALGNTNKGIGEHLVITRGTVKAHAASIYRKLDVANRTEAVARARQLGILL